MKRISTSLFFALFFSVNSFAEIPDQTIKNPSEPLKRINPAHYQKSENGFFFKPAITLEYSAPVTSSGGSNSDFKTNNFGKQLRNVENIAIGTNLRVHEFLGFNINWAQTDLNNTVLQDVGGLSRKAHFKLDQYNFSALFYAPVVKNTFELFAEAGVSDMTSRLSYARVDGTMVDRKAHETMGLYGAGFQVYLSEQNDSAIRFSVQKYAGKQALLNTNFTTVRVGYLKSF